MSKLQRKALTVPGANSGKTISRKALSRASSAASSRATSRQPSRAGSRIGSTVNTDDEGDYFSDSTNISVGGGIPVAISALEEHVERTTLFERLESTIERLCDSRKTGYDEREETLRDYVNILAAKYAHDLVSDRKAELLETCLRSVKSGRTEKESILAVRAIGLTILTDPTTDVYDTLAQPFKQVIMHHGSSMLKTAVIHCLGTAAFYGGATETEVVGIMDFLLDIVQSDGHSVGALDDGVVVTAAVQEWAFLCSQLDDAEEITKNSMDAFVDQLDSDDVAVQAAVADTIAFLYEKSCSEADEEEVQFRDQLGSVFIQRYEPYHDLTRLKGKVNQLASGARKHLSKNDKRTQKSALGDLGYTLENPMCGPRYSPAIDLSGSSKGASSKIKIGITQMLKLDRWWKLVRVEHLKRLLESGFMNHWLQNTDIFADLDLNLEDRLKGEKDDARKQGGRYRSKPRREKGQHRNLLAED